MSSTNHHYKSILSMSAATVAAAPPSWSDLKSISSSQSVGAALDSESVRREAGRGSAFVQSKLRLFDSADGTLPKLTLYRDHAGWCPYCQKTMLLIEEKKVPINIELVPMRSYGDKPREFLQMVPSGLLPALLVQRDDGQKQVITESAVIMELLDRWHPVSEGYRPMLPSDDDSAGSARYDRLARLERDLFSWWCTLLFRPEGPRLGGAGVAGIMDMITGAGGGNEMSGAMRGFLDCLKTVDQELTSTSGPWFFGEYDYPTMIDFVYVSHLERMLASCAYWKGLDLRSMKTEYPGINAWFDAFEKRECYLAFKSDYFTHVMDIPPQYGPGYEGGFEDKREIFSKMIIGRDGQSWNLPLSHDDPLQPLYRGPPLPLAALEALGIGPDHDGTYEKSDPDAMAKACRQMAGWKLAGNGIKVSRFAARGGSAGAKNPRKSFQAQLADPYADPDDKARPFVDAALRVVCSVLLDDETNHDAALTEAAKQLRSPSIIPTNHAVDVASSLAYLRDRVGVPRDMPLAAARHFRAHLNWAIDLIAA